MISYNSSFNNTIPTMSNTTLSNNNEENNLKVIVDGNISFKKDDNTIENNISNRNENFQNYDDIKTEWSCVYDLDNFKLYFVSDRDTSKVYEVTRETFK